MRKYFYRGFFLPSGVVLFFLCLQSLTLSAQSFMVNTGYVSISASTTLSVSGSLQNNTGATIDEAAAGSAAVVQSDITNNGSINGRGTITLNGNWINNNVFNCYTGTVRFSGAAQQLSGTSITTFYNLNLDNSGIKTQTIDAITSGTLNLNSVELATGVFNMYVSNPALTAIQRVNGFVSSSAGGTLQRATNNNLAYLFPVGSSSGTTRYRPVEIAPASSAANIFEVRFANVNPTSEGYDINLKESIVCSVNPLFYHVLGHPAGSDNASLALYYDNAADGSWDALGNWLTTPSAQWYEISGSATSAGAPFYYATASNLSIPVADRGFALTKHSLTVDLGADTALCSGENLVLDAGNTGATYNWSSGTTGQTITVSTTNTYSVTVTNSVNGCQSTDQITVTFTASADATITAAGPFCEDDVPVNLSAVTPGGSWTGTGITNSSLGTFNPASAGPGNYTITYGIAGSCGDTATTNIQVLPRANPSINAAGPLCESGTAVTLSATEAGGTWSGTGVTNASAGTYDPTVAGNGIWDVIYTIAGQCGAADTISIVVTQQLDASINAAGPFCTDSVLTTLTAASPGGIWSGTGITNSTNGTFDPTSAGPGTHIITYAISGACGDTATASIVVLQRADATIVPSGPYCNTGLPTNLTATDPGGLWSGTGITNSGNGTFDPSVAGVGNYTITYTISGQCGDSDTETITVIDQQDATIATAGPFCDNNNQVTLSAVDAGGNWSGTGIASSTSGTFDPALAGPGNHLITYAISGNCGDTSTTMITVNETPDLVVTSMAESCSGAADGSVSVSISGGATPYSILWDNSSTSDSVGMLLPGIYMVTVTDNNGCIRTSSGTVDASTDSCYLPHVYIPNIFSPNGDFNNDVYFVQGKGISAITISIYDRWGEKVFETNDLTTGWDGQFNGKPVEEGPYPYVISLVFENQPEPQVFNGYISVVR